MLRAFQRTIRRRHEPVGATNLRRLERWMGAEEVALLSRTFAHWPGPPVALGSVPGNVYVTGGGEFIGPISVGDELSHLDMTEALVQRAARRRFFKAAHSRRQLGAFANLQAVLDAVKGGKSQVLPFQKGMQATGGANISGETWTIGTLPAAGSAGAAAPGGTATTNASTGALNFINPVNANTSHHLGGSFSTSLRLAQLLLVDQLFRVAKTMNSTATEAVTGTFARYQSATATAGDYIGGNFCYPAAVTLLGAAAHNWTVCQYTDQAGNTAQNFVSTAGISGCAAADVDIGTASASFFLPLASGDVGVKALTQMQCSGLIASGTLDFVVAHPIAMYSAVVINQSVLLDCLTTAVSQLSNVYDNACLTFVDILRPTSSQATFSGSIVIVGE